MGQKALVALCAGLLSLGVAVALFGDRDAVRSEPGVGPPSSDRVGTAIGNPEAPAVTSDRQPVDRPGVERVVEASSGNDRSDVATASLGHESDLRFEEMYKDVPTALLLEDIDTLDAAVREEAHPILQQVFEDGLGDWVAAFDPEQGYRMPVDNHVIDSYRFEPTGDVYRAVLDRSEHPEIYSLRDQANWIRSEVERRHREGAHAK